VQAEVLLGNPGVAVGVVGIGVDGMKAMVAVVMVVRQEANGPLHGEERDAERVLYRSTLFSTA